MCGIYRSLLNIGAVPIAMLGYEGKEMCMKSMAFNTSSIIGDFALEIILILPIVTAVIWEVDFIQVLVIFVPRLPHVTITLLKLS